MIGEASGHSDGLSTLIAQQNDLLTRIFTPHVYRAPDAPNVRSASAANAALPALQALSVRGLAAYRANAQANAERALQAAYPVIAQLVGDTNFGFLARDFWQHHPPQRGDLGQWGGLLAQFLAASAQLADTPYLADVAQIEWALHTCATAADGTPDTASFTLLTQCEPDTLTFQLSPGASVLCSTYPAATLVLAHLALDSGGLDHSYPHTHYTHHTLSEAFALLRAGTPQNALVWRHGYAPCVRALSGSEYTFTQAVCQGASLAHALNTAHADFDLSAWLLGQVRDGLVLGVRATQT